MWSRNSCSPTLMKMVKMEVPSHQRAEPTKIVCMPVVKSIKLLSIKLLSANILWQLVDRGIPSGHK